MSRLTIAMVAFAACTPLLARDETPQRAVVAAHVAVANPQQQGVTSRLEKPKTKAKRRSRFLAAARWVGEAALFGGEPPQ